jgi:Fe-S-cluster-containing hydrogenase component 2
MQGIYEESRMSPDCFSCGECLPACKFDAISYARKHTRLARHASNKSSQ